MRRAAWLFIGLGLIGCDDAGTVDAVDAGLDATVSGDLGVDATVDGGPPQLKIRRLNWSGGPIGRGAPTLEFNGEATRLRGRLTP